MFRSCASRLGAALAATVLAGAVTASPARAQIGGDRYAAIVTEVRTGAVLYAASPDESRYPASLTKMMTVYMAFEALRDGRIELTDPIRVSANAAAMPPSRLGLTPGMTLTVEEAILALVTKSANDAAAAFGEFLGGGSEQRFAQMMTLRARALGMTRTTFRNASGLPDLDQVSTARDMALLGRRLLQDFPRHYAYFSTPHFVFRGRTHWNHNRLLQEYDGTDGIKTGYVNDSGFNLVASTQREGVRLIAAVFGGRSGRERDRHMMALLDQGFGQMGVAPRDGTMVASARRAAPVLLASARAATLTRGGSPAARAGSARPARATAGLARSTAARSARAATARAAPSPAPARPPMLRLVTTRPATARVEQGDTGRSAARGATQAAGRPAAAAAKPKPGKAAAERPAAIRAAQPAATRRRAS